MKRMVDFARIFMKDYLHQASICVDFTMGNGNDTLWLAKMCPQGHVTAFDIQPVALKHTQHKLDQEGIIHVDLILDNHINLEKYIDSFDVGVFNLGYLPGCEIIEPTKLHTTKLAIEKALERLVYKGLLIIVIYPGHVQGKEESEYLKKWSLNLNPEHFISFEFKMNNKENSPYIIGIEKRMR